MKKLHPDWEVVFFSEGDRNNFVSKNFPEFESLFNWYPREEMKSDLFRLMVVYSLGGFYIDMDFLLAHPLDPLLGYEAVLSVEQELPPHILRLRYPSWMWSIEPRLTLGNYAFGGRAGHPFFTAVLDEIVSRTEDFDFDDCNELDVLHATGAEPLTTIYYREIWEGIKILQDTGSKFGKYGHNLVQSVWRSK